MRDLEALIDTQKVTETRDETSNTDPATAATVMEEVISPRWQVYGAISRISGETYIVKPVNNRIPQPGTEVRVMQSLSEDRVIHIADGYILSANTYGTSIRLSSIFSTPEIDDLVYIETVAEEAERTSHTPSDTPAESSSGTREPPGQSNRRNTDNPSSRAPGQNKDK